MMELSGDTLEEMHAERPEMPAWVMDPKATAPRGRTTAKDVIEEITERYNLSLSQIVGGVRTGKVVNARKELYFLLYTRCPHLSVTQIGQKVGRDHSTIIKVLQKYCAEKGIEYPPRAVD